MKRTAEVQTEARIGKAKATMESGIKEAAAEEQQMKAKYVNDTEVAKSQRDYSVKKAEYDMEVNTKVWIDQKYVLILHAVVSTSCSYEI